MTVTRYNPFDIEDFAGFMNRLFTEPANRSWAPAVDISETENDVVLKADVPGVKLDDLDIRLENGTLTVKGERKFEKEEKDKGFHRIERGYGAFSRAFTLPETLDAEKVKADYKDGVLTITIAKKEIAKPRQVKVEISGN